MLPRLLLTTLGPAAERFSYPGRNLSSSRAGLEEAKNRASGVATTTTGGRVGVAGQSPKQHSILSRRKKGTFVRALCGPAAVGGEMASIFTLCWLAQSPSMRHKEQGFPPRECRRLKLQGEMHSITTAGPRAAPL